MPKEISFYFDFMSPYAYLGSVGIERLAQEHGCVVDWRPILLGISVVKVMGLKELAKTPLKKEYVHHDVPRFARYLGIPFNRASDEPMAPLPAARAFVWLKARDPSAARKFAIEVFRAHWANGRDMSTAAAVAELASSVDIDPNTMLNAIAEEATKQRLKDAVEEAISTGVFGAPTFIVGGEMFWGADRLPMVGRWLETGGW